MTGTCITPCTWKGGAARPSRISCGEKKLFTTVCLMRASVPRSCRRSRTASNASNGPAHADRQLCVRRHPSK